MPRYIDATRLQAKILDASITNKLTESKDVLKIFDKMVQSIPTADVVEVVRCKDCKFRGTDLCTMSWYSEYEGAYVDETEDCDFCSYGKKEEEH